MSSAIEGLKPHDLWRSFAGLSAIPRESKNEKAAGDYVIGTAKQLGLEHRRDATGNVVVRKPASSGHEQAPSLCLQGHLDMVCVARPGTVHDFAKDPIRLVRNGDSIAADGTTLGADNGIAVAMSLALMSDPALEHGPLEFLFTVNEETGLTGARTLDPELVRSRILINLDSEEEGVLTVGCSGGRDTTGTWELRWDAAPAVASAFEVKVTGLKGGHSGTEIHQGRGNAIKMLVRILVKLAGLGGRLARLDGGSKRNAIPGEASAVVVMPKAKAEAARGVIAEMRDLLRAEIGRVEPGLDVVSAPLRTRPARVLARALQRRVLQTLTALPHGVVKMSAEIPGLVETSTNAAVLTTGRSAISLATSQRSSVASEIADIIDTVTAIFELGGAEVSGREPYPGWKPNLDSRILGVAKRTWSERTGQEIGIRAVHAGLECGILGERILGLDMVSLGPDIHDAHTPDERVEIASVERTWDYLLAILRNVARGV